MIENGRNRDPLQTMGVMDKLLKRSIQTASPRPNKKAKTKDEDAAVAEHTLMEPSNLAKTL